jgi:hypothetical protein
LSEACAVAAVVQHAVKPIIAPSKAILGGIAFS